MHIPLYRAVDWIALNDNASCGDFEEIRYSVTVIMAADLFGTSNDKIAKQVIERRQQLGYLEEK